MGQPKLLNLRLTFVKPKFISPREKSRTPKKKGQTGLRDKEPTYPSNEQKRIHQIPNPIRNNAQPTPRKTKRHRKKTLPNNPSNLKILQKTNKRWPNRSRFRKS
jgi:hypothetical protein